MYRSQGLRAIGGPAAVAVGLCLAFAAWGQNANREDDRVERTRAFLGLKKAPDPVAAGRGQLLYTRNCGFCHGPTARGAEGPDLLRSTAVLHDENGETIAPILKAGRPEHGMPAFPGLQSDDVRDLAAFLHNQVELAANRGTYQLQNIVTGDAEAGKRYFNGQGKCVECHSASGDLANIRAKYQPPELQALFLYPPSVLKRPQQAIVTSPDGATYTGEVKAIDDFQIVLTDTAGKQHTFERSSTLKVEMKDPFRVHREMLRSYTNADMHNMLAYLVQLR